MTSQAGAGCAGLERHTGGIDLGASLVDLGFADDERRQKTHDIVAGLHREHALGGERLQQRLVRHLAFQPEHETLAAHLLDDAVVLVLEPRQPLLEPEPHRRDVIEKARREHHIEHSIAHGHGKRITAEGRAVASGRHGGADLLRGEAGA